ncbi:hypothetical protein [Pseudoxanthomonas sp. PXM02]|uniref:hypothetical protein n=1 Tax=Pseudoxanthomonas sp. PXM02 TaxID=2769294 RepID=UPI0017834D2E|nr:hypothetical protein [Pseudoxanthomonas sp. PXM02]
MTRDRRTSLVYLGYPLVHYDVDDGEGVRVVTRAYIDGFQNSRVVASAEGARRYADAWMAKWGEQAMGEVRNKVLAAEAAKRTAPLLDAFGQPYPVIEVKRRPARKGRR